MSFSDAFKKIGGGVGDLWNETGGKVVSGVADGAEAVGGGVVNAAKGVGGAAVDVAEGAAGVATGAARAGVNVATGGALDKIDEQNRQMDELRSQLKDQDKEPSGAAKVASACKLGPQLDKTVDASEAVSKEADKDPSKMAKYTVVEGDTLSKIADEKNIDMNKLTELNPELLKDPNSISVGQELNLGDDVAAQRDELAAAAKTAEPAPAPTGPEVSV